MTINSFHAHVRVENYVCRRADVDVPEIFEQSTSFHFLRSSWDVLHRDVLCTTFTRDFPKFISVEFISVEPLEVELAGQDCFVNVASPN